MSFASPRNLLRSTPFRLGLIYLALFGGSGGALLGFLYWSTAGSMLREADATIEAEISGLDERYRLTGLGGLTVLIRERLARRPAGSAVYLLSAPDGSIVVGNLDRWPTAAPDAEGWVDFRLENPGAGVVHRARAQVFDLRGGFRLLVGRDMHELEATRSSIIRTLGWGLALTAALALGGAV
ncbi:MAG: two-component sensor histidine kinase, partial [Acidobacteriota bacterium]